MRPCLFLPPGSQELDRAMLMTLTVVDYLEGLLSALSQPTLLRS